MSATSEPVIFVIPTYSGGGAERITTRIAQALHDDAVPVLVVALLEPPGGSREVPSIGLGCATVSSAFRPLAQLIRRARPPTVVTTLKHVSLLVCAVQALTRGSFRHVVRVANTYSSELELFAPLRRMIWKWALRYCHATVERSICVSVGVLADLCSRFGATDTRSVVIPNPVEWQALHARALEQLPLAASVDRQRKLILAVGRLTPQKDFATLLRSFRLLLDGQTAATLLIVGEGPERAALERLARELQIDEHVQLPGWISNPFPLYRLADLLVLSSRYEGMPNVVLEALAFGLPVVATDCPSGPREILVDARLGSLVPVGDARAMCKAMQLALAAGRDEYRREYVAQRYDIGVVTTKYRRAILGG
jgi:glycosyltransferase involved in cell wall biosynthesis